MSTKKDFTKLIKSAEKQGWKVIPTANGHLKWLSPTGADPIVSGSTESDIRGLKNHLSRIRRAGYIG